MNISFSSFSPLILRLCLPAATFLKSIFFASNGGIAANRSCLRHAQRLERQLVSLDHEGTVFFTRRREALEEISDPEVRLGAAASLELDLEHFLEYQASAVAALDAYDELHLELNAILEVLSARPEPRDLTDEALDLRNHAWSLRMILEDCERASSAFDMR